MLTTIAIKNYELTLPFGDREAIDPLRIKIFPKSNNKGIKNVLILFRKNNKFFPPMVLDEDIATKLGSIKLSNRIEDFANVLDFLRNENNRYFSFEVAPNDFTSFGFTNENGDFINVHRFDLREFALHTNSSNNVDIPQSPVIGPVIVQ